MRRIPFIACWLVASFAFSGRAASATATAEVVKMSPVKVHAGFDEFVPSWVFDTKPPRLVLQLAERVRTRQPAVRWLVRPELGIRHGDQILSVNGKRVDEAGFLELWRSVLHQGTVLSLELKSEGANKSRKVEYTVAPRPPGLQPAAR